MVEGGNLKETVDVVPILENFLKVLEIYDLFVDEDPPLDSAVASTCLLEEAEDVVKHEHERLNSAKQTLKKIAEGSALQRGIEVDGIRVEKVFEL